MAGTKKIRPGEETWAVGMPVGMNLRQALFVQEYLVDLNGGKAYKRAGYTCTDKSAAEMASKLLQTKLVKAAIDRALSMRMERMQITQDRVLAEYAKIAFLDPRRFFNKDGTLMAVHEMPEDVAATLSGIDLVSLVAGEGSEGNITTAKIKFSDKKAALDSIAKHLGMFTDKMEVTGKDGGPQEHVQSFGGTAEDAYRRMLESKKQP